MSACGRNTEQALRVRSGQQEANDNLVSVRNQRCCQVLAIGERATHRISQCVRENIVANKQDFSESRSSRENDFAMNFTAFRLVASGWETYAETMETICRSGGHAKASDARSHIISSRLWWNCAGEPPEIS